MTFASLITLNLLQRDCPRCRA